MTKKTKGFDMADFAHVTEALLARIQHVVNDRRVGRYSSSLIYKTHNELFGLHEPQQTCPSCLQTRARAIEKWNESYSKATPEPVGDELVPNAGQPEEPPVEPEPAGADQPDVMEVPVTTGAPDSMPVLSPDGYTVEELAGTVDGPAVVPPTKMVPQPAQILLQKIDKDDYSKTEGDAFFANFDGEGDKGIVTNADTGKSVQAGTYATDRLGFVLSVQPGGKATYKAVQA